MEKAPEPPEKFRAFIERYPKLREAWDMLRTAEEEGPLDARTRRLLKLAMAVGSMQQGAVRSSARKASAAGASREELEQIVALGASIVGMPSAVAAFGWLQDVLGDGGKA